MLSYVKLLVKLLLTQHKHVNLLLKPHFLKGWAARRRIDEYSVSAQRGASVLGPSRHLRRYWATGSSRRKKRVAHSQFNAAAERVDLFAAATGDRPDTSPGRLRWRRKAWARRHGGVLMPCERAVSRRIGQHRLQQ